MGEWPDDTREIKRQKASVSFFLLFCSLQEISVDNPTVIREAIMDSPFGYMILEMYQARYRSDRPFSVRDPELREACMSAPKFEDYHFTSAEWTKKFKK